MIDRQNAATLSLGDREVRRIGYGAMQLAGPGVFGPPKDHTAALAVLRAAAGYHAFRRVFPRDVSPGAVVGFLLLNHAFPRSLVLSLQQIEAYVSQLRSGYGLHGGLAALERLDDLRGRLSEHTPQSIILVGLHEFMDNVQQDLMNIQKDIAADFWPVPDAA